jgi:DivIVA domain-containing protein
MTKTLGPFDGTQDLSGRLSPAEVHRMLFARAGLGRRGYDEAEVDAFLDRVQAELSRLIAEKSELRDEAIRWREEAQRTPGAGDSDEASDGVRRDAASVQAIRVLSAAQQMADQYVSDAEHYSKRMSSETRQHCEEMIEQARAQARTIVEEAERKASELQSEAERAAKELASAERPAIEAAPAAAPAAVAAAPVTGGPSKQELEEQIAHLRMFGQVTRAHLRAYLEALLRDVEEEWGKANPQVVQGVPALPASVNGKASADGSNGSGPSSTSNGATAPAREQKEVASPSK